MKNKREPLDVLINEQLSSVVFVQDYLQLDFDGNTMTCNIWPTVHSRQVYKIGDPEYRNAICSLISLVVTNIDVKEKKFVNIEFKNGSYIKFNLEEINQEIGNAFILDTINDQWSIY